MSSLSRAFKVVAPGITLYIHNLSVYQYHHFASLSEVFFLARLPLLWPLTRESKLFVGALWSASVGISRLPASPAPHLGYMKQKGNSGDSSLCCSLHPVVPSASALFSLPFRVALRLFYMSYPRSLAIFRGKDGEKYLYFIFPEAEVLTYCIFKENKYFY